MNQFTESETVKVWDFPVRVFHWLAVICFVGAYVTAEEDGYRLVHVTFGYTLGALMMFRIFWGLYGTTYARFSSFIKPPSAVFSYLKSLLSKQPEHHVGHNPAGALAILLLLVFGLITPITGWFCLREIGGEWVSEFHELLANSMLALVLVHVFGVVVSSLIHRENLVKAMVTGRKLAADDHEQIRGTYQYVGVFVMVFVLAFWGFQFLTADVGGVDGDVLLEGHDHSHHPHEDCDDD
jgi:cytochrome b